MKQKTFNLILGYSVQKVNLRGLCPAHSENGVADDLYRTYSPSEKIFLFAGSYPWFNVSRFLEDLQEVSL
jgi:hypothetical protein